MQVNIKPLEVDCRITNDDSDYRPIWVLEEDVVVSTSDNVSFTVKKGYRTDWGSAPRYLAWFAPPMEGTWSMAYMVHDASYNQKVNNDRSWADRMLRCALVQLGCPSYKAWIIWATVRILGQKHWGTVK